MFISGMVLFLIWLCYAGIISYYHKSWKALPTFTAGASVSGMGFSVIIPARNEAASIGALLESLLAQDYPRALFEIILVDDHSSDATPQIAAGYPGVRVIRLTEEGINSYKKKAIETGIAAARQPWIVCTDADCILPPGWLSGFAAFIENSDPVFVAAPVRFIPAPEAAGRQELLFVFQTLDFLTLQGITGASVYKKMHSMCNGANLAYRRDVFEEVAGFKDIDGLASGDDMLLMHKIWLLYPDRVGYLKSPGMIVDTAAAASWKAFIQQRIRWASKAGNYDDKRIFAVLLLVYLFNAAFLILIAAALFEPRYLWFLLILWILKTAAEFPFVRTVSRFFGQQHLMRYFLFFQPLHIAYTLLAGFLGSFGNYEWKGRKVR
ncbi:glycosyltransferase [Niabella terrae]